MICDKYDFKKSNRINSGFEKEAYIHSDFKTEALPTSYTFNFEKEVFPT